MCGIGAVCGRRVMNGESLVRRSLEAVAHRGYSLHEIAAFPGCALGANRLEITDAKGARQPQTNEEKSVFVVFNGEIFNFLRLRNELARRGHRFRTLSDTEVLAHMWEEYREGMAARLDSEMFAFFIFDKTTGSFFAARDPYGVKPLYYAVDSSGNFHFASEIKQLAQFSEIGEVKEFPPGHYMLDGALGQYHRIPHPAGDWNGDAPHRYDDVPQIILSIRRYFDEAVKKRVATNLPVCVFFSGGIDSAAVLATARKYHPDVTAITAGKPDSPDLLAARRYCDEYGIRMLSCEPLAINEFTRRIPEFVRIAESFEPGVVSHTALYYSISELARKNGFRIALCGEGADELFGGYQTFQQAEDGEELSRLFHDFISNLPRTQFQRLDRATMAHTVEARAPFFDTRFADYVMGLPPGLKAKAPGGKVIVKWLLREAMRDRLPGYIIKRGKVPLNVGSGYERPPGIRLLFSMLKEKIPSAELENIRKDYPAWGISDNRVAFNFRIFAEYGYTKAAFSGNRLYGFIPRRPVWDRVRHFLADL